MRLAGGCLHLQPLHFSALLGRVLGFVLIRYGYNVFRPRRELFLGGLIFILKKEWAL